jgi:hypothetical protein
MNMSEDVLKYVNRSALMIRHHRKISLKQAYMLVRLTCKKAIPLIRLKEFEYTVTNTKTVAAAEAKYNIAQRGVSKTQVQNIAKNCVSTWLRKCLTMIIG